jgi:hypothetical protein
MTRTRRMPAATLGFEVETFRAGDRVRCSRCREIWGIPGPDTVVRMRLLRFAVVKGGELTIAWICDCKCMYQLKVEAA